MVKSGSGAAGQQRGTLHRGCRDGRWSRADGGSAGERQSNLDQQDGAVRAANELCRALYGGALDDDRLPLNLARYLFLDPHTRVTPISGDVDPVEFTIRTQLGQLVLVR